MTMGKFSIFVFAVLIFVGIGIAVHRGWNNTEKQEQVPAVVSENKSAGEKISIEELASKGEKVSLDEALSKIDQANEEIKVQAEKFSIRKMVERLQKDGPAGLAAFFRGGNGENHDPQSNPATLAKPSQKGPQIKRKETDNTDSVRLEIERLRKEEDVRRQQQENAKEKTGQAPQQSIREKPGENEKKDFFSELREMWETFKSVLASSE
jgi:hypothetical protein